MGFRAFLVMDNKVARQAMAENGGKWQIMVENGLPRENGRKWISACYPPFPYYYYTLNGYEYEIEVIQGYAL